MENSMNDKPYIHAGNLSPEDLRQWLNQVSSSAGVHNDGMSTLICAINSRLFDFRFVEDCLAEKINFLSSPEIIRSEDHSSAIQEDLRLLCEIEQSMRGCRQAIEALILQHTESQALKTDQAVKDAYRAISKQVMQEAALGHAAQGSHPHEACE